MSRETENALLLLLGLATAIITISGVYTRYVKPSLLPWLAAVAVLLIVLALARSSATYAAGATTKPGPTSTPATHTGAESGG